MTFETADAACDVHAVIVNYQSARFAIDCLRALEAERGNGLGIIVTLVDSFSQDDSVRQLEDEIQAQSWQSWVSMMRLPSNRGFAAANNQAIKAAKKWQSPPEYTLLLNPDTKVRSGAIGSLLRVLKQQPQVGIVGSRLEWENGKGQRAARRFPSIASELESTLQLGIATRLLRGSVVAPEEPAGTAETDWVVGASMMIRNSIFDDIGYLDEDYFLYFEEVDFCFRAWKAGWRIWFVPESRVIHYVGSSTGVTSSESRARCPAYWFESRRRYFLKNQGRLTLIAANIASLMGLSWSSFRDKVSNTSRIKHERFLYDFIRYNFLSFRRVDTA